MLIHRKLPKPSVTPGFFLLVCLLFYLDDGSGVLLWGAIAALLHEIGHIVAAALFGGRVEALSLSAAGAELRFCYSSGLSYGHECLVALAGPAVNLLFGVPALWLREYLPAVVCLSIGVFNLLPILPLDGGRILFNLVAERFGPNVADRVLAVTAGVLIGLLAGFGMIAAMRYANFMLLLLALWLLFGNIRKQDKYS